jgi:hypothetical protein
MTQLNTDRPPKIEGYDLETVEGCRAAYRALRFYAVRMSHSAPYADNEAFDRAAGQLIRTGEPTPRDWVSAAKRVAWPCKRCATTGRFITYVENGQPKGPGGPCFRCDGKGVQSPADAHRNYWHDVKQIVRLA